MKKLSRVTLGLRRPLPIEVTDITAPFWRGLGSNQFLVPQCNNCTRLSFPPRAVCPECLSTAFDWYPVSGRGTLYAQSKIHNSPAIYGLLSPIRVAIVDLEEGVRLLTRLLPGSGDITPGNPVQLVVAEHPDGLHYAARGDSFTPR